MSGPAPRPRSRPVAAAAAVAAAVALAGLSWTAAGSTPAARAAAFPAGAPDGGAAPAALPADTSDTTVRRVGEGDVPRRAWSFPVGERFRYSARYGRVKVGHASLEVEAVDTIGGTPAYRLAMEVEAGVPFCKIDDRDVSWVHPRPLRTLRYQQHKEECPNYTLDRRYDFEHGEDGSTWTMINMFPAEDGGEGGATEDGGTEGAATGGGDGAGADAGDGAWRLETVKREPTAANAIDQVAYLYLARMVPLEVGRTYRFDRYFQEDGNPVVLEVLRREEVRVPAGTFETVVVRPIIQTEGAFGKGGEAEIHITDDERRIPVQIRANMKIGSVHMYLTEHDAGETGALVDVP